MTDQNGFEMHKITHSSASSINAWSANPGVFIMDKLLKKRRPASAAMWRGITVEDAVAAVLMGSAVDDAVAAALAKFDKEIQFASEKTERERAAIEPMVELALAELKQYGEPEFSTDGSQQKVEINCAGDGWKLPIIGYLDLVFPTHGLIVDLKTTMRMPSKMSPDHIRQRCIYQRCAGNSQVKFLYVTPKKSGWLEDGDVDENLEQIKAILNRQERFLRISDDPEYLASIVPIDPSHFYWSDCIEQRQKIFGV